MAHFDSVPTRYEPEFQNALSTMQRLKRAEDKKKQEAMAQTSSSSSSWHWHTSWWESDFEHSPQRWYDHWIAQGKPVLWWLDIYLRKESQRAEEFRIFTVNKSFTADRQSTVTDGECKGNVSCTSYSRTFLRYTNGYGKPAYILTHNLNKLEHIAKQLHEHHNAH